jgi:hypothetical protein
LEENWGKLLLFFIEDTSPPPLDDFYLWLYILFNYFKGIIEANKLLLLYWMETLVALLKIYPFTPIKRLFFLKGKLFLLVFLECRRLRFEGVRGKSFVRINLHIEKIRILTATKDKIILQKNIFLW